MEFFHISTLKPEQTLLNFHQDIALVADGWMRIVLPDGTFMDGDLPIVLIARATQLPGFKVYWGTTAQTYEEIYDWGRRITDETVARAYFPMLSHLPFVKE